MTKIQSAKQTVLAFHKELEQAGGECIGSILDKYTNGASYTFRSIHPFREIKGTSNVTKTFWQPLKDSFTRMQRRPDIFIGGENSIGEGIWVMSMGHFMGLFDNDWLGIRSTRQVATIRYAEFSRVTTSSGSNKIVETGLFLDLVGLMQSVGMNPLPPSTGCHYCYPGPRTHDGLFMNHDAPPKEGNDTQDLVDRMIADLTSINHQMTCAPEVLQRTWHDDMIWYGPAGIGATYTIPRYQEQHQLPFRSQLADKKFHGHQVRIAEGNYAAFFGWPMNLSNSPIGGFLGLPGGSTDAPMQVVDVYRREGEKLAENWVLIDIPYYLKHQGVDILARTTHLLNPKTITQPKPETKKRSLEEEKETTIVMEPKDGPKMKAIKSIDAEVISNDEADVISDEESR